LLPLVAQAGIECGLSGSIPRRIRECNSFRNYDGSFFSLPDGLPESAWDEAMRSNRWALVMRMGGASGSAFWKDLVGGLIWSSPLGEWMGWEEAAEKCRDLPFLGQSWALPSGDDYRGAERRGIRNVLQMRDDGSDYWWTSSEVDDSNAKDFSGFNGLVNDRGVPKEVPTAVRCVSR
jgi:hypothetical protein